VTRGKVLIAEDEVITSMDLWHLLEMWGFDMCPQVTSGEEAIEVALREQPDVVLMDISLKGTKNGIESAAEIRTRLGIPVIFMSGYHDPETRKRAEDAGAAGFFVKPLDFYKLRSSIEALIKDKAGSA